MPDFLVEDPSALYFLLFTAALFCGALFWLRRERKYLISLGVVALLIFGLWLLNRFVVTDSEQIVEVIKIMAVKVPAKDFDGVFEHVSEELNTNGYTKATLKKYVQDVRDSFEIDDIPVWDFEVVGLSRAERKAKVRFFFKPKGKHLQMDHYLMCTADFVLDADNKWRIKSFQVSNPYVNVDDPLPWPAP